MKLTTLKWLTLSTLFLNLLSLVILTRWKIGAFHLTQTAAIGASFCLGWCVLSLGIVLFRDWKAPSTPSANVDIDSINSFTFKNLSEWEKFGVAIIFIADFTLTNTLWADTFIIFFFLFWMITFRIGHQHISGKNGYKAVGSMLGTFLVVIWLIFASGI